MSAPLIGYQARLTDLAGGTMPPLTIASVKVGRLVRIPASALHEYIRQQTREARA